jgi:LysM repeat protein
MARPLRLTKRGRFVFAVLVVVVLSLFVLLVTALVSGRAQATNHGQARAGYQGMHQVVVRPGQTLWSIAASTVPTADPRIVVQQIMTANALSSSTISAGQLLWVP